MNNINQAVILAAGEGQRLRPFTASRPKVMIKVANRPLLQYVIEALAKNGIRKLAIVVGYKKEQIQDFFGAGERFGVDISYVVQKQQLGTAHAIKQSQPLVKGHFLALAGDSLVEPQTIAPLLKSAANTILVTQKENASKYGVVGYEDGRVTSITNGHESEEFQWVSTGNYYFDERIFDFIGQEVDQNEVFRNMLSEGVIISAVRTSGQWLDIAYPWDILQVNDTALQTLRPQIAGTVEHGVYMKGPVSIGKGSVIMANSYLSGPLLIGENCRIGPNACVFASSSLGDNVTVSSFCEIRNSVIEDGVTIGPSSLIVDSVIDRSTSIGSHLLTRSEEVEVKVEGEYHKVIIGAMIGENCLLGDFITVNPGVMIGNSARIKPLRHVMENIADRSIVV